ncbi:RNA polymerase sigma factor [Nannocystis bainbridge]|uniref:Sigma-70 family RNA polymerase sigma factor n=1 Tax=Nannocystis bainbridge TaxID=2995303 RepID=A0ABT5DRH8_9BACT|nr:sigma-70 family RNA polymerase sigma factor [Nannocystis bainbridge]MDC0716151.1 sigma-70 family RNA polymerase sigma factor [Nannocystis bainbridge]
MRSNLDDSPAIDPDDFALARACAGGDLDARRRMVREYHPHLIRFLGNKVPRQHVEDLVNDTFIRLFERGLGAYGGQGRLRSFVLAVAYRRALEHFRGGARVAHRDSWEGDPSAPGPSPSRVVAQKGRRQTFCAELRRLPAELQEVLEFHYWNGLTTTEIAGIVGRPVGTVRWQLRQARERLKDRLLASGFDAGEWIELTTASTR